MILNIQRPRRNRKSEAIRAMVQETQIVPEQLIFPFFLMDGISNKIEISSMPGIFRQTIDQALQEAEECMLLGLRNFILFPAIDEQHKDRYATYSYNPQCYYLKAIREFKSRFPECTVITDVAMDPYSSDGHDGIYDNGNILNDETLAVLDKMALAQAAAGADILGPSDMMDGRVGHLRKALDANGFSHISIMSYTAKYASFFFVYFLDGMFFV
jgi:porphobilinogen synthase